MVPSYQALAQTETHAALQAKQKCVVFIYISFIVNFVLPHPRRKPNV